MYAAERVYMAPFSMIGLNENYAMAAEKLMNVYIEDNQNFTLVNYTQDDSIQVGDREAANRKAIEKNCSKYIMAEFTRLGENVITSFKLYDINNENTVWSDRLKAKNPDDFDPIIQRVARNIGTKNKAVSDDDIYSVTSEETKKVKKKGVSVYNGVNIIGNLTTSPEANMDAGLGYLLFYDARDFLFSLETNYINLSSDNNRPSTFGINISMYKPFGTSNIAPFAGGGFAYSWNFTSYDSYNYREYDEGSSSHSGLSIFAGGGVMFNRASSVAIFMQLKYYFNFFKTPYVKDNHELVKKHMQGFRFSIGLGF